MHCNPIITSLCISLWHSVITFWLTFLVTCEKVAPLFFLPCCTLFQHQLGLLRVFKACSAPVWKYLHSLCFSTHVFKFKEFVTYQLCWSKFFWPHASYNNKTVVLKVGFRDPQRSLRKLQRVPRKRGIYFLHKSIHNQHNDKMYDYFCLGFSTISGTKQVMCVFTSEVTVGVVFRQVRLSQTPSNVPVDIWVPAVTVATQMMLLKITLCWP